MLAGTNFLLSAINVQISIQCHPVLAWSIRQRIGLNSAVTNLDLLIQILKVEF